MPSLQDLGEFKASFNNIGGELKTLAELNLPLDDLPLPDHEPAAGLDLPVLADSAETGEPFPDFSETTADGVNGQTDFVDFGDIGDLAGGIEEDPAGTGEPSVPGQEDIDFGTFIDSIPDPASPPADDFSSNESADTADDFNLDDIFQDSGTDDDASPPELLDGFAEEIEAGRESDAPAEEGEAWDGDFPDFEEAGFDEIGESETGLDETGLVEMGESETALDEIGLNEIEMETPESEAEPADLSDLELSGDEDSFDLGGELSDFDTGAVLEEIPGDSFDDFKLDISTPAGNFDLRGEDSGSFGDDFGGLEEFSLPGVDNIFDGSSPLGGASARASRDEAGEVEEIRLTDEELEKFEATLSSYPLNLRIVCEELIAEQAIAPDQMSQLVKLLVNGASARETAALAGKILNRTIPIPKTFEKKTGEALEAEQSSFAYIFVHNFLPVLRLFMMIALVILSVGYLSWRFIYTPLKAEGIYKLGLERIGAGEYSRANDRFREAFGIHEKKSWFYTYARAFREARQYTLAEEKYQELLNYTASKNKRYIPEKAAVLEYADMETNVIGNYQKADELLRHNILDYSPFDRDALLALGDNSLAWGEYEASRFEDARESYAKLMERYGRSDPLLERMLKYFIRTDNLEEVLALKSYFMASDGRKISATALAEMGGYLLDKRYEKIQGVPNEYLDSISGIRDVLLRAVRQDSRLPESYYQLARYYNYFENSSDERLTLELAVRAFEAAKEETPRRITYHINTLRRYGEVLIGSKEFFPAEENLVKAVNLYQDGLSRRLLTRSPEFARIYADLGDLEYFVKDGDMQSALDYYLLAEQNGWAPPEIQYRMGAAYYQLRQWGPALDRLFAAYRDMAPNRRILYALGNVSYMRGNYFAAQGYYDRLLEILNADRDRLPPITPTDDEKQLDLAERLMVAQNNLGATLEALTERTGNNSYRSRAQALYSDSERAWDILTRNPQSMIRMRPSPDITAPGVNPAYLNIQNNLHPVPGYQPQFFLRIDKDMLEPSPWEDLAPPGYRLSQGVDTGR